MGSGRCGCCLCRGLDQWRTFESGGDTRARFDWGIPLAERIALHSGPDNWGVHWSDTGLAGIPAALVRDAKPRFEVGCVLHWSRNSQAPMNMVPEIIGTFVLVLG